MPSQLAEGLTLVNDAVIVDGATLSAVAAVDESANFVNAVVRYASGVSQAIDDTVHIIVGSSKGAIRFLRRR